MQTHPDLPYESRVICSGNQKQLLRARNWKLYTGQKPSQELIMQPALLCNTVCTKVKFLSELCSIFFIPLDLPRFDWVYGTWAGMPINVDSDSFTQLLTFSSLILEGAVEGSSLVTGFIKLIFQPCPPLDTDIKWRRRHTREEKAERACCCQFVQDQAPGIQRCPKATASGAASLESGGQGLCQLWVFPSARVEAVNHLG